MFSRVSLFIFTIIAIFTSSSLQGATILHAGRMLDMTSNKIQKEVSVVIEGNTIKSVEEGYLEAGQDDTVIDLKEHTLLPGLMDMHTHLDHQYGAKYYLEEFTDEAADRAYKSVVFAKRTLDAGFTTVRDLGDRYNVTVSLRNAINSGLIDGPRIFTSAKSISTTGGHQDKTNGITRSLQPEATPRNGVIDGPYEAVKAVRQRYKDGADLIKITATGGVLSVAKSGQNPQFNDSELEAIINTAKDYDFHVAAHAHGAEGMKRALRAGVSSIEHGTYMDEDVINLLKKFNAYYVPTIIAGKWVGEKAKIDGFFPEVVRPKAATIGPVIQETFARANKAGVNIAFGTDSGVSEHGRNAEEFVYMVEAGMTPINAIKSATVTASELLGVADKLGTIESDKLADIIAVKGNPLDDVTKLQRIDFIMKDGKVYKQPIAK
jgi:imidazolonepropionase-like amidohydrolase